MELLLQEPEAVAAVETVLQNQVELVVAEVVVHFHKEQVQQEQIIPVVAVVAELEVDQLVVMVQLVVAEL
tara:strand:+ start:300 stop:509 length:210 start_codon:yes stop_codon:yes gene_type:complete